MPALLRYQGSAGAQPCQGRSSLDRTCSPPEHGSYREARTGKISQFKVSTLSGGPRGSSGMTGVAGGGGSRAAVGVEVVAVQVGDAEGQVQGLAAVQAGIAGRLVTVSQVALG